MESKLNRVQDRLESVSDEKSSVDRDHCSPPTTVWCRAVDDEMAISHLGVACENDSFEDAKRKLHKLIQWHIAVAIDPCVNGGFELVKAKADIRGDWLDKDASEYSADDVRDWERTSF